MNLCEFNFTYNMKRRKFVHFQTVWIWASYLLRIECHYFTVGHTISSLWMRPATLWLPLHISESNDGFDNLCFYQKENYMLLCQLIIMMVKIALHSYLQYTELGSLIGNTQCGNFRIFLPLRFYVKSILVILKLQTCCVQGNSDAEIRHEIYRISSPARDF